MPEIMIQVQHVHKTFGEQIVLNQVSLSLEKGKIHGLVGRNGSGKTMLMKVICGFVPPDSGSVQVDGKRIGKEIDFPQNFGFIIESPSFLPLDSAYRNLKYYASIRNKIGKRQIEDVIRLVGLNPDDKKHVGKYSMGMRQRLGLAQAMMEDPDLLILDEPMNGLDNDGVCEIRTLLGELRTKGKTILLASHNREDIDILCDSVYEMDKGTLHVVR